MKTRNHSVLNQNIASITHSIAGATVIKDDDIYFLCKRNGDVPLLEHHGYGLYHRDCRYLCGYELELGGQKVDSLISHALNGSVAVLQLTNPEIQEAGKRSIPAQEIVIQWKRVIDKDRRSLEEVLTFVNYGDRAVKLPVKLMFDAKFEDVAAIRGLISPESGEPVEFHWKENALEFRRTGGDGITRRLEISMSVKPETTDGQAYMFVLTLEPRQEQQLQICLSMEEFDAAGSKNGHRIGFDSTSAEKALEKAREEWDRARTQVTSDSLSFTRLIERSFEDLRMLRTGHQDKMYIAAGVPWFVALFGRDTIITSLQTLAYVPSIAEQTLRLLAKYQGKAENPWRDEEPGKILHELRVGELANTEAIPHTPYYGTIDATPLFLILLGEYVRWTGKMELFQELSSTVEAALRWIDEFGDKNKDGFVEYDSDAPERLINQGWKDSGNAILDKDGKFPKPPISLIEVQAYVCRAKLEMSELFAASGNTARADRLRRDSEQLQRKMDKEFWLPKDDFYAMALDGRGEQINVISSNPGHALWAGVVPAGKAPALTARLMKPDMFNGWGIRTLSTKEAGYNPTGYHLGTVWPHENSLIAAGFRRYGEDKAALKVFAGLLEAANHFEHDRLPELFCDFPRDEYGVPVRYPVACHPQAWSAGSIPYLLTTSLGFEPNALRHELRVVRPVLPAHIERVELQGLRVGNAAVDLRFIQKDGHVSAEVLKQNGKLDIIFDAEE